MKKFIALLFLFFFCFSFSITAIRFLWVRMYPRTFEKNFLDSKTRYIVLGPSNGVDAWNDSIIPFSRNLCGGANSLGACYNVLKWTTEYNQLQVDTIILCASFVAMVYSSLLCLASAMPVAFSLCPLQYAGEVSKYVTPCSMA